MDEQKNTVRPPAVPETAATYERTKQETEAKPGEMKDSGVLTARDEKVADEGRGPLPAGAPIEGSMHTEEPDGWDLAPNDIQEDERKRHPRPDGVGGSDPNNTHRADRRKSELD